MITSSTHVRVDSIDPSGLVEVHIYDDTPNKCYIGKLITPSVMDLNDHPERASWIAKCSAKYQRPKYEWEND